MIMLSELVDVIGCNLPLYPHFPRLHPSFDSLSRFKVGVQEKYIKEIKEEDTKHTLKYKDLFLGVKFFFLHSLNDDILEFSLNAGARFFLVKMQT